MQRLRLNRLGLSFKNPIVVASTDIGRSLEMVEAFAMAGVGGIITKSVTDAPELQQASISMMHIANVTGKPVSHDIPDSYTFFSRGGSMISMDEFEPKAAEMLQIAKKHDTVLIGSISASRLENWVEYAKRFEALGFPAIELNFGNPHGEAAGGKLGFLIGQSEELCTEIASKVLAAVNIPVIVKLTPQVDNLVSLTKALQATGVKAVTVMHRFQGLMIDEQTDLPVLGGWAAIGGPWMKPLSLANISKVKRNTELTIFGGNGADTVRDVYDFLLSGADFVQIGSGLMLRGAGYAKELVNGLATYLKEKNIASAEELIGKAARAIVPYQSLSDLPARQARFNFQLCDACAEKPCVETCYFDALSADGRLLSHKDSACSGCGLCSFICPKAAASIEIK